VIPEPTENRYLDQLELAGPGSPTRWLTDTETLRLTVFNAAASVRVALRGRKVDCYGESKFASNELVPTTNRAASIVEVQPGAGWLVGAAAILLAGAPLDGQTYAVLSLGIGSSGNFTETEVLAAGTVTSAKRIAWPGSTILGPLECRGALRSIAGTTPGAGVEITETIPTGARDELIAFRAQLVTSATVANRVAQLILDDGAAIFTEIAAGLVQAASLTIRYDWAQGYPQPTAVQAIDALAPLPIGNELGAGYRMRSSTLNIQAGDQWSAVQYLVRERIEGA